IVPLPLVAPAPFSDAHGEILPLPTAGGEPLAANRTPETAADWGTEDEFAPLPDVEPAAAPRFLLDEPVAPLPPGEAAVPGGRLRPPRRRGGRGGQKAADAGRRPEPVAREARPEP